MIIPLTVVVCVLFSGCLTSISPQAAPGSPTAGTPTSDSASDSLYTDRLNERLTEYETSNETGEIRVIVALENGTSDAEFNRSVHDMNRTATVRYTFQDQRLIALGATPAQLDQIVNMSSVKAVSVDRQVTAETANETPV